MRRGFVPAIVDRRSGSRRCDSRDLNRMRALSRTMKRHRRLADVAVPISLRCHIGDPRADLERHASLRRTLFRRRCRRPSAATILSARRSATSPQRRRAATSTGDNLGLRATYDRAVCDQLLAALWSAHDTTDPSRRRARCGRDGQRHRRSLRQRRHPGLAPRHRPDEGGRRVRDASRSSRRPSRPRSCTRATRC